MGIPTKMYNYRFFMFLNNCEKKKIINNLKEQIKQKLPKIIIP